MAVRSLKGVAGFLLKSEAATRAPSPPATPDGGRKGVGEGLQLGQNALTSCASWVGVPKATLSAHARSCAPGSWSPRVHSAGDLTTKVASEVGGAMQRVGSMVRFQLPDSPKDSFIPVNVVWGRRSGSA